MYSQNVGKVLAGEDPEQNNSQVAAPAAARRVSAFRSQRRSINLGKIAPLLAKKQPPKNRGNNISYEIMARADEIDQEEAERQHKVWFLWERVVTE